MFTWAGWGIVRPWATGFTVWSYRTHDTANEVIAEGYFDQLQLLGAVHRDDSNDHLNSSCSTSRRGSWSVHSGNGSIEPAGRMPRKEVAMFRYNKAVAAAISSGATGVLVAMGWDPEITASIGTLATMFLTWLVPNKE